MPDRPILYEFIEAPAFDRYRDSYLDDEEFRSLQQYLADNPEAGREMQGTGGVRKLRWQDPRRGKGKRGGLRVIYYAFLSQHEVWLMMIYSKDEMDDLTPDQKRHLRQAIQTEKKARGV